ncbi:hypothetical protein FHL15_006978 [Xylaria flabelliformis]|uniref:Uncharacterized protein n=1 Tax=Xylaria flabelliformis TaxID=2512241 RepID=A0A553HVX6_9PEZI|nr:hypothetical protein FHL15_006978 [Xylaria flabelliformis]
MSDKENKKPTGDLTYPPAAYIRVPRQPDVPPDNPKPRHKQQDIGKDKSLEWLKTADSFEDPDKEVEQVPTVPEEEGKMKSSNEGDGSLNWLIEAANYEPREQSSKKK